MKDGQTDVSNYKNSCLQNKSFLRAPGQALNSGIPGTRGKKREFRTFSYLDGGGEKVFVPLGHTMILTNVKEAPGCC